VEVMEVKGEYLLGPNSWYRDKRFIDGEGGALLKVLEAYMVRWCGRTHPSPNGKASMGIGPTWEDSCLVWLRLL
jgi:hypothetical protein